MSRRVANSRCKLWSQEEWNRVAEAVIARATAPALNAARTSFDFRRECHRHCTSTAPQPLSRVSGTLRETIPISTRKKHADKVPVMPGKRTLKPEAIRETQKYNPKSTQETGVHRATCTNTAAQPAITTNRM